MVTTAVMSPETVKSLIADLKAAMEKDPSTKVFTCLVLCVRNLETGKIGTALYNFVTDSDKYCNNEMYPEIEEIYNRYKIMECYRAWSSMSIH